MLSTTRSALNAILSADPSVTSEQRASFSAAISNPAKTERAIDRIVKRSEASRLLGLGLKRIDQLARSGQLQRVIIPGCARSIGFSEKSIRSITEGVEQIGGAE